MMRRGLALALALLASAGVAVAATYPAPSLTLQSSFSPPLGVARSDGIDQTTSTPVANAVDGDRIYTVGESGSGTSGDAVVFAHRLDGSLDPSFSDDGRVVIPVGPAGIEDRAVDVAILPDHTLRVLVATSTSASAATRDSAIVGLTADGAPDTSFGAWDTPTPADGIVFLGSSVTPAVHLPNVPAALAVGPDGRLAVTGRVAGATDDTFAAVRNADGSPTAFGGDPAGIVQFDHSGDVSEDLGVDVAWRPGGGLLVLGSIGPNGSEVPFLRAIAESGSPDPAFSDDGDLVISVGTAPTDGFALLLYGDRIWLTGSTRTGTDTDAFLARLALDGSDLQSRTFDMRGQLIDPTLAVTSVGDSLTVVPGTPDTLVVGGSVASGSGTDWAAAAFNDLGSDLSALGFGTVALSIPGDGGIAAVAAVSGQRVAVAGPYRETVTTPSSSVTYTRSADALLAVDADKQCNLALAITKPLELVTPPRQPAPVTLKVTNNGTRACSGTVTAPAPWTVGGPASTRLLAPGESTVLTGTTLTYAGTASGSTNVVLTLAASGDSDTSDNAATLHVRFGICDVGLAALGGRALMPSEGSRRFVFSLTNGGTTSCSAVRVRVTGQGVRTNRALPFAIEAGREFSDTPAVRLRTHAKVGSQVLIGFRAVSASTDSGAGNDAVLIAPRVLGVGDTDARLPRGRARVIRGVAHGGLGPATKKLRRVTKVSVAVRRLGGGCRWLSTAPKARFRTVKANAKGKCLRPVWLPASGTAHWRLRTRGLPGGKYELLSRATIAAGFSEARFTTADRNRLTFAVRK